MIRFDHVSKQYSGTTRPALNAINLEVLRGEFVFLVGASGSGKSSCLRLILKEEKPTKGKIHVLGQDLGTISSRKVPYFRRNIGVVFQDFRLLPNKTVFENVAFTLQVIGKSRGFIQEAVPDVLKMVGLDGKAARRPHELSGGEQQRVAIARAVVNKPQVLLADEPTGNLDPATSAGIMAVLERINAGGTTVLMATHEAGIVDQMKRRVIELVNGQIVRDERHGGYGFTAAIPTAHIAVRDEPAESVTRNTAPTRIPSHQATEPVAPRAFTQPVAPVQEQTLAEPQNVVEPQTFSEPQNVPQPQTFAEPVPRHDEAPAYEPDAQPEPAPEFEPATASAAASSTETGRLSAHFAAPPTQPIIRPRVPDHELPEQLTLAEKLGLRAPGGGDDEPGEQNVGPTK
jgi:cell division transport system ATP-binding protein